MTEVVGTVKHLYDDEDGGTIIELKVVTSDLLGAIYTSNHPMTGLPCLAVKLVSELSRGD